MKQKLGRKLLSFLLTLAMVVGLVPGMSLTAYADNNETLLTTITPTGVTTYSETTSGVVTVSHDNDDYMQDYGWVWRMKAGTLTVSACEGYTITKCIFKQSDYKRPFTFSSASFELHFVQLDEFTLRCQENLDFDGISSIEVYGYATQTITAEDVTVTYGDTGKAVSASVTDPKTGGGTISYAVKSGSEEYIGVDASTGALTIKNVPAEGKAYVTVTAAGTAAYEQATKDVTVTINKAESSVAEAPSPTNPAYTGEAQALVTPGTAEGGTMQYSLDGKEYSEAIPTGADVGAYTVWYKVVGDANHNDTEPQKVTSTIAKPDPKPDPKPADAVALSGSGHVQNVGDVSGRASGKGVVVGTEGRGLRLEALSLSLPKDVDGGIECRAHVQNKGWGDWAANGKECGTRGSGLRLEAVQVRLTGKLADAHSVWYRAHVQNLGTLGWSRDGQAAGTAGRGLRVESLEVCVLPKGEVPESGVGSRASFVDAVGGSAHSQNVGWAGTSSSLALGTTGRGLRLEAVRLNAPALPEACGISYEAHVQNVGWQGARSAGQVAGTTGQGLRTEAVRISLTGEAAKEGNYSVWYRVHSQNQGWLGWAHDGADAGTVGRGLRAEAVQVQVLPQGQVPAGYDASKAACVR